jgi:hypothetical protein
MELSDLEIDDVGVPLHLRRGLEDGYHLIQRGSGGPGDQANKDPFQPSHSRSLNCVIANWKDNTREE